MSNDSINIQTLLDPLTPMEANIATLQRSPPTDMATDDDSDSDNDPYVVPCPVASDLVPYPELLARFPNMAKDFFQRPLEESDRGRFLLDCPRNTIRQYQPPSLNCSDIGPNTKRTDDIQFRLSGLTRPMDTFAHDLVRKQSVSLERAWEFLQCMYELTSDVASHITQLRRDNVCRELHLPSPAPLSSGHSEPAPLLDTSRILEQVLLADAPRETSFFFGFLCQRRTYVDIM
ncbi:hypothetical protein CLU79DRAFT_724963 [Phycomyces nitens]|nr:hypothetical protein CLU79DRAFT_724963 [Phycomyces nitens]